MKVSLVMPTINVTTELDLFLKSLKAQTYKDFELIVVDQNEGNEVFEIVKDYELENSNEPVIKDTLEVITEEDKESKGE